MDGLAPETEVGRERTGGDVPVAVQQRVDETVLVDTEGDGLAHGRILGHRAHEVHVQEERAARGRARLEELVVVKKRMAGIRQTVGAVNFARLHGHRERVAVADRHHLDPLVARRAVPVVRVALKFERRARGKLLSHIRARADHNALARDARGHIHHRPVGIAQIIEQRRTRFARADRHRQILGLDGGDLKVASGARVLGHEVFKTGLDGGAVHRFAVGELQTGLEGDLPGQIVDEFIGLRQPGLHVHLLVVTEKRLAHAVAKSRPARVRVVRIDVGLFVFRVKGRVPEDKLFGNGGRGRGLLLVRAARQGKKQKGGGGKSRCAAKKVLFDHGRFNPPGRGSSPCSQSEGQLDWLSFVPLGSNRSRSASPKKLKVDTAQRMATPGASTTQG